MTIQRVFRNRSDIGFLDYLLTGVGGMLAVYSAGMAINEPETGYFLMVLVAIGTAFSFLSRRLVAKTKVVKADGFFYAMLLIGAVFATSNLNQYLPGAGFPIQLRMAGVLCWMLALCSFCTWRDGTLLFQAIPSIALFGLVGCYDTFRNVTFTFFGFLICLATLFARAHARDMLLLANASGFFGQEAARQNRPPVEESSEMFEQIRGGPWRWIAGPEWALASALIIILVSLLGAPVIQESVRGVSGFVTIPQPQVRPNPQNNAGLISAPTGTTTPIGRGPNQLRDIVLYEASMDSARYLRTATFDSFTGNGWSSLYSRGLDQVFLSAPDYVDVSVASIEAIADPEEIPFRVKATVPTNVVPVPGELLELENRDAIVQKADGTFESQTVGNLTIEGRSLIPTNRSIAQATTAKRALPSSLFRTTEESRITPRVRDWARQAARGGTNDLERAQLLKAAIAQQVRYNLRAAATPQGKDPVEHFLFDAREGYCDLYATAMALGARSIGIPSRYVVGYLPDPQAMAGQGTYIVRERDAHAWAELFFEGVGWVVYDATEGSPEVANAGRGDGSAGADQMLLQIALGVGIVAGGGLGFWFLRKRRPGLAPEAIRRRELERAYVTFANTLGQVSGRRRQMGQTPTEYLDSVRPWLNGTSDLAAEINRTFVSALYSPAPPDADGLTTLHTRIAEFKTKTKDLKKQKAPVHEVKG